MKSRTINKELQDRFANIRKAIQEMQDGVNTKVNRCADRAAKNAKMYSADYNRQLHTELIASTSAEIMGLKQKCRTVCDREFLGVRECLRTWMLTPMTPETSAALELFVRNGITPSRREIQILQESAQGNYLASKLLDTLSRNAGFWDTSFRSVDDLEKDLAAAQSGVNLSISAYQGQMHDNTYVATVLGLEIVPSETDTWFSPAAETIIAEGADNSFTRTEAELLDSTESEFSLLPSKRAELDQMLDGLAHDDRIRVIQETIESNDTSMRDAFELYDKNLFGEAAQRLAEYKREQLKEAIKARTEAAQTAETTLADIKALNNLETGEVPQAAV